MDECASGIRVDIVVVVVIGREFWIRQGLEDLEGACVDKSYCW